MSNIIGIDVGKMSLDCAWLRDLDQDKPKRKKVENSPHGLQVNVNLGARCFGPRCE